MTTSPRLSHGLAPAGKSRYCSCEAPAGMGTRDLQAPGQCGFSLRAETQGLKPSLRPRNKGYMEGRGEREGRKERGRRKQTERMGAWAAVGQNMPFFKLCKPHSPGASSSRTTPDKLTHLRRGWHLRLQAHLGLPWTHDMTWST